MKMETETAEILMETVAETEIKEGKRVFFFISVLYKLRGTDAGCIFDYDGLKSTPPTECKEWKEPHQTHNDGKNVDIGFGGLNNMNQQLRLLRDVIIDNGGQLPYDTEGRDMSKTKDHFHVKFNN